MKNWTRREFIERSGLGIAGLSFNPFRDLPKKNKKPVPFRLGLASYSFRNYPLDKVLAMANRLQISRLSFKSMHLPLESSEQDIKTFLARLKEANIVGYAGGVIYMTKKEEVDNAFRYAGLAGMEMIIGSPAHELLPQVEAYVKKTGIKVAIHNHGPDEKVYPSPESVYQMIKDLDPGIGLCMDIGHTARLGLDPAEQFKTYSHRILDMHIKDVTAPTPSGETIEIGRGIIDFPSFVRELVKGEYQGTTSFEYEKDADDIMPGLSESVGFFKGVIESV